MNQFMIEIRFTPPGCKGVGVFEFVAKNQFLNDYLNVTPLPQPSIKSLHLRNIILSTGRGLNLIIR